MPNPPYQYLKSKNTSSRCIIYYIILTDYSLVMANQNIIRTPKKIIRHLYCKGIEFVMEPICIECFWIYCSWPKSLSIFFTVSGKCFFQTRLSQNSRRANVFISANRIPSCLIANNHPKYDRLRRPCCVVYNKTCTV